MAVESECWPVARSAASKRLGVAQCLLRRVVIHWSILEEGKTRRTRQCELRDHVPDYRLKMATTTQVLLERRLAVGFVLLSHFKDLKSSLSGAMDKIFKKEFCVVAVQLFFY